MRPAARRSRGITERRRRPYGSTQPEVAEEVRPRELGREAYDAERQREHDQSAATNCQAVKLSSGTGACPTLGVAAEAPVVVPVALQPRTASHCNFEHRGPSVRDFITRRKGPLQGLLHRRPPPSTINEACPYRTRALRWLVHTRTRG